MPLNNSSEVYVPAKQYRNSIRNPWILRSPKESHYVPLFTSDHMHVHKLSLFKRFISMHKIDPYINDKTLWFIHINTIFALHIYRVRSYSKHRKEIKVA